MQFGPISYGRIAKIAAQLSNELVNSATGQIPCSTERISSYYYYFCLTHTRKNVDIVRRCNKLYELDIVRV